MNAYNQVMKVFCKEDGQHYDMVLVPDSVFAEVYIVRTVPFFKWWTRPVSERIDSFGASDVLHGKISPEELMIKFEQSINKIVKWRIQQRESLEAADRIWTAWNENRK